MPESNDNTIKAGNAPTPVNRKGTGRKHGVTVESDESVKEQKRRDAKIKYAMASVSPGVCDKFIELLKKHDRDIKSVEIDAEDIESIVKAYDSDKSYEKSTTVIRENFNAAMKVAEELCYVKNTGIFKLRYNTFEEYVETEFDFTRIRAHQLAKANEVALLINSKVGEGTIVNESQARQLRKLKCVNEGEDGNDATNDAMIKLMRKLKDESQARPIPAKVIKERVSKIMEKNAGNNEKESPSGRDEKIQDGNLSRCLNKFTKEYARKGISSEDKANIKKRYLEQLTILMERIKEANATQGDADSNETKE